MEHISDSKPSVCFQFQVEKILGISADGRYQVQWAPAWVSKFHLVGCEHLIQEFLQEQAETVDIDTELNYFEDAETKSIKPHSPVLAGQLEMQGEFDGFDSSSSTNHHIANCIPHLQLTVDAVKEEPDHLEDFATHLETGNSIADLELTDDETIYQTSFETPNYPLGVNEEDTALEAHSRSSANPFSNSIRTSSMDNSSGNLHNEYHLPQVTSKDDMATDVELQKQKQCCSPVDDPQTSCATISRSKKRHSCTECKKVFRQRGHLIRHLRTHSGEKPFKCTQCHISCSQKDGLIKHMRIHSGIKPFACKICQKSFTQSNNLNRHHQRVHSNKT